MIEGIRADHGSFQRVSLASALAIDALHRIGEIRLFSTSTQRTEGSGRLVEERLKQGELLPGIIGQSKRMLALRNEIDALAKGDLSVGILGERGVGKELVAGAIHRRSKRHSKRFVAQSCAAFSESLFLAELFGNTKSAFTQAAVRDGCIVAAHEGTLFLDEVGDTPAPVQAALLRALQERKVKPLGVDTEVAFDVRIICATNKDLQDLRPDFKDRVAPVTIEIPPLRDRFEDLPLLIEHFSGNPEVCAQLVAARALLEKYHWPGNVRELGSMITTVNLGFPVKEALEMIRRTRTEAVVESRIEKAKRIPSHAERAAKQFSSKLDAARSFERVEALLLEKVTNARPPAWVDTLRRTVGSRSTGALSKAEAIYFSERIWSAAVAEACGDSERALPGAAFLILLTGRAEDSLARPAAASLSTSPPPSSGQQPVGKPYRDHVGHVREALAELNKRFEALNADLDGVTAHEARGGV